MKKATNQNNRGLLWAFEKSLEDLDFADDIALLAHRFQTHPRENNRLGKLRQPDRSQHHHRKIEDHESQQQNRERGDYREQRSRGSLRVCLHWQ